jgi:hypothetical protein
MQGHVHQKFIIQKPLWFLAQVPKLCQNNGCQNLLPLWQKFSHQNPLHTSISIVPYDEILDENKIKPSFMSQLPNISIIEFVRVGWPIGQMVQIPVSHMGFLIKKNGKLILRHAKWHQTVKDEDFLSYIQKIHNDPSHLGVHILG